VKRKLTILFTLFFYIGFSQCEDFEKIKLGGSYTSKTNNYIPFEIKYKDSIYKEDISYPFDIKIIEKYSNLIFKKEDDYIIERAGKKFFEKLDFDHLEVNYKDSAKVVYENRELYELSKQNVTYWMIYTYSNKKIKYAFGLEFNKKGELISENMFPDISKNIDFENLTDYCKALEIVKSEKQFAGKTTKNIELTYLEKINSFCWLIEENAIPNKVLGKWEEKSVNLYFVNANTNKLELVEEKKSITIACGFGPLSKEDKKSLRKERRKKNKENK
jgi:hypothetical protein